MRSISSNKIEAFDNLSLRITKIAVAVGVALFLLSNLWISDDAAITLRSVLNFHHGNGATFNAGDRVQSFSHPFWFVLISVVFVAVRDPILATFATSLACCSAAIWIVARPNQLGITALLPTVLLLSSRAFVDYGLSGLENPLSALLIASTFVLLRSSETSDPNGGLQGKWVLAAALLVMTRIDNAPFLVPPALYAIVTTKRRAQFLDRRSVFVALLLLATWIAVTVAYYGTFLPNTSLAKLSHNLPRSEVLTQGFVYLAHSVGSDPVTGLVIAVSLVAGARFGSPIHRAAVIGIGLHLVYTVWIGGDFMSGRFLSTSFVAATWMITDLTASSPSVKAMSPKAWLCVLGAIAVSGLILPANSPSRAELDSRSESFADGGPMTPTGIVRERDFYFESASLLGQNRKWFEVAEWSHVRVTYPRRVEITCGGLGALGLSLPPEVVLLDSCALADPFLSRKAAILGEDWRIGHLIRDRQDEYFEYLITGEVDNSGTETFIAEITAVEQFTRGSVFDFNRFLRGMKDSLAPLRLTPAYPNLSLSEIGDFSFSGQAWDANPDGVLEKGVLQVRIDPRDDRFPSSISLLLDSNDSYCVDLYFRPVTEVGAGSDETHCLEPVTGSGLTLREIEVRKRAALDSLVIRAVDGDDAYAVGAVGLGFDSNP